MRRRVREELDSKYNIKMRSSDASHSILHPDPGSSDDCHATAMSPQTAYQTMTAHNNALIQSAPGPTLSAPVGSDESVMSIGFDATSCNAVVAPIYNLSPLDEQGEQHLSLQQSLSAPVYSAYLSACQPISTDEQDLYSKTGWDLLRSGSNQQLLF